MLYPLSYSPKIQPHTKRLLAREEYRERPAYYTLPRGRMSMATTQQPSSSTTESNPGPGGTGSAISLWRALLLGLLLIPVNVFWITVVEVRWYTLDGTSLPLFITPVFILFLLVLVNLALRKAAPRTGLPLRQEELLLVYVMLVVSCTFAGHDTLQNLFGSIGHAYWHATPSNNWQSLFFRFLPNFLLVTDQDALKGYYNGRVSIYSPEGHHYLASWTVPLIAWGLFFLTLLGMYLCLTILVRRPWIDHEKLTFPLVQLPLAITADDAPKQFFQNPVMWAGFVLAFAASLLNGLHLLLPTVPELHIKLWSLDQYFTTRPWNAMGSTQSSFYPFMIGIAYFMPLDLSFSCWFFYILARAFRIVGEVAGWNTSENRGFPFFGEQAAGAWLGLGLGLLYAGRRHWIGAWRLAWAGARSSDPKEALRYRCSFAGLIVGAILLAIFTQVIGMSAWVGLAFFGIVFLLGFTITRVRAEFGAPHEIVWVNPIQVLVTLFGTRGIGTPDLTAMSVLYWFNRGYRNHPMPNQLEAFKMLEDKPGARFGGIVTTLIVAMLISLVATDWANLHVTYAAGGEGKALGFKRWVGDESYSRLASWITQPLPPASTGLYYIAGGFLLAVVLSVMRAYFVWWPFHPAGYALALSYAMEYFWMPVFIAWLLKFVILRYGGIKLYRQAIPFFLGLILGDYTIGSLWAIIGPVLGIQTYKIYI